jgi:hypothetical protein
MIDYRQLVHRPVSDRASFEWDDTGKIVTVHFLAEDLTAIALTMSKAMLKLLWDDIAHALADKQRPNLHQ